MEHAPPQQSAAQPYYQAVDQTYVTEQLMPRYNRSIVARMLGQIGALKAAPDAVALDFGAGIGTLARLWAAEFSGRLKTLELDPHQQGILREHGFDTVGSLDEIPPGTLDIVYSSNVLEHIEDDIAALRAIYSRLKPGGRLLLYVPALQSLWSDLDTAVGHVRRYSRPGLRHAIEAAGFRIDDLGYSDSLGVAAWFAIKLLGFRPGSGIASDRSYCIYDNLVFPISTILDRLGGRYLIGKNLFVAATRP
ncbi:MAG: class I SAM-dependent methyltransferase [Ferrovibrio sp.]|uniref:class I SAM-dependent methyltransferase n=1 Tax=Ferrovibrio sp. TaxID=1917215 RepID=UPI0026017E9A|nr:class I SAM-dependent methyltransferase [Ferrovibrio sp.]MCW0232090.1 class I SAM-dependent methyltransferase [Ferrovibrio sp.]